MYSRRFVGLLLLLAASTLVAPDLACMASCLGDGEVSEVRTGEEAPACHKTAAAAGAVARAGNHADCTDAHLEARSSIVVSRQTPSVPPVAVALRFEPVFTLGLRSSAATAVARCGPSPGTSLSLRI